MFRIHVPSITETGWQVDKQVEAFHLPLIADLLRNKSVEFARPVRARIRAHRSGETVGIVGHAQTAVRPICSRCLEPFEFVIDNEFSVTAVPETRPIDSGGSADETELRAEEIDVIPYAGDTVDLATEIAQQIIMALPYKPLCRDSCKGLCSRCGINLNEQTCQCHRRPDPASPFAALKTLALPPEKD